ncbi:rhodanese-like domain-containing protein [Hwangdonia lutea]|uniref:Rhodanese-like domain-containing protein n=1 Tax=Hwangdonia lutea TaxID=3075823 RepID=A0AA97HPC2_9FLAO|nr:rhodanese-like domain-containing protein [Hwangdonia sp. SCSIO 19198]WOD42482.1 rhodanese-like domain-containing protein [Hwangdonia sp. SCSIO 19198]
MKKAVLAIVFLLLGITFVGCNKSEKSEAKVVSPQEVQALIQLNNVQLIDVRTPKEFKEGHIKDAQNIDFLSSTFTEDIKTLDKEKPIIVYCRSGRRSANSTKKLQEAGFTEIYDLEGGILKWEQEGFDVTKSL